MHIDVQLTLSVPSVCQTNQACSDLVLRDPTSMLKGKEDNTDADEAVCYKEGFGVKEVFQMCDVTSESPLH